MTSHSFIGVIVCVLSLINSGISQDSFEAGVAALDSGDPQIAKEHFLHLVEQGKESKELYANLGRSYYEEGDIAHAILYYERSSLLGPGDKEIAQALETVRRELDIRISEIPDFILVSGYKAFVTSMSPNSWAIFQIIIGLLFCFLLYKVLLGEGDRRKFYTQIAIGVGILCLLSFVFAFSAKTYRMANDAGIVMTDSTSVLQAPDELSKSVSLLSAGNKVYVIEELGEWYKVRLRDRDEGWIKKEEVTII